MNAVELSLENIEKYGEYTATHFEGRSFTNVELADRAKRLATVLTDHGVEEGDRVMVMMPNSPDVAASFRAIWTLGAVITPVTPQLGPEEVRYLLEDAGAKVVITLPLLAPVLAAAADGIDSCRHVLVIGESDAAGTSDISPLIDRALPTEQIVDRVDDDLAVLLYTSGTTGKPKGVMQTHANILSNARSVLQLAPDFEPGRIGLAVLPLSHSYGILMMNLGALLGAIGVILPWFEVEPVYQNIERYRVDNIAMVPTMMTYMLNFPDRERYDTSSLETIASGGAALPEPVRLEMERVFGVRVKDGYGMSECTTSVCGYHDEEPHRPGSVGRAIPDVELKIADAHDNALPPGEEGEICIRGPNVMKGYWRQPDATVQALRGGWMHSGDLGKLDEDGYLFITGRLKDLIIKGGENISPNEIEEVIHRHPAVSDVAVIGVPDTTYGENIWALVVPAHDRSVTEDELKAHIAGHLAKFKVPTRIIFRDDLPKTHSGKVMKTELRREAEALIRDETPS